MDLPGITPDVAVLTTGQVCVALGYRNSKGQPDRRVIYGLLKERRFPPPIDDTLTLAHWRWSRVMVEAYITGEWVPGTARPAKAS